MPSGRFRGQLLSQYVNLSCALQLIEFRQECSMDRKFAMLNYSWQFGICEDLTRKNIKPESFIIKTDFFQHS